VPLCLSDAPAHFRASPLSTLVGVTTRDVPAARTATPAQGRLRVLRGSALAVAAVLVPATAHVAAGGAVPVDIAFLLAAAALGSACVAFADRRRNLIDNGAVVVLSQPIMHAVLSWSGHHEVTSGGLTMITAHIVAGDVVACLLAGAETVVWAWSALCSTVLWTGWRWTRFVRAMTSVTRDIARPIVRQRNRPTPKPSAVILTSAPRRGPPTLRMA